MQTLIIYSTHHGTVEKIINKINEKIDNVHSVNIKKENVPDLNNYNTIIIGGSIHVGTVQKKIRIFCNDNLLQLKEKKVGLFLCCMHEGEIAQQQFDTAYPEELRQHAAATGIFGGEFDMSKMNFIEKLAVKKAANVTESISKIDYNAIDEFIEAMKK